MVASLPGVGSPEPAGFSNIVAPFMTAAMRRANKKDLALLKTILEARTGL